MNTYRLGSDRIYVGGLEQAVFTVLTPSPIYPHSRQNSFSVNGDQRSRRFDMFFYVYVFEDPYVCRMAGGTGPVGPTMAGSWAEPT